MKMRTTFLPFALPDVGESELQEIKEVLESGWITTGPKVRRFEQEFAEYVGAPYAVAVNSCTAAMHVALEAVGVRAGDFVITTPYTFAATAEVIRYFDATPVFVDVEADTFNIDPQSLVETIDDLKRCVSGGGVPTRVSVARAMGHVSRRQTAAHADDACGGAIRAVIPVHIAGHPCDMEAVTAIASSYGLSLVEDCAHACSASSKGRPVGSAPPGGVPWAACFSFYATKTLATGEGGMITTDSERWADRFRMMSLHGISKDAWKRYTAQGSWRYEILAPGYKYNMTDLAAALGLAQLRKVESMRQRREEIAVRYNDAFGGEPALHVPHVQQGVQHAWHLYMLRLNVDCLTIDRDAFIVELKKRQIGTSVHFIPLHLHPYYEATYGYMPTDFPVAYREFTREISLPIYSAMTDADVQDVIDAVLDVVMQFRSRSVYAVAGS